MTEYAAVIFPSRNVQLNALTNNLVSSHTQLIFKNSSFNFMSVHFKVVKLNKKKLFNF